MNNHLLHQTRSFGKKKKKKKQINSHPCALSQAYHQGLSEHLTLYILQTDYTLSTLKYGVNNRSTQIKNKVLIREIK